MTSLLVGCPVFKRGWSLPHWFTAVEVACDHAGVEPSYVFVGDPRDHDSFSVIDSFLDAVDREAFISWVEEAADTPEQRVWNESRYHRMVYIRNQLLRLVRQVNPDYFLSLDSDIFLHLRAVRNFLQTGENFNVVGGKCYMTPTGKTFPSYGMLPGLRRPDADGVFPVDVVMAIKLMDPEAYNVDYQFHEMGEDIGISCAWREAGLSIAWDARVVNKHAMDRSDLEFVDERCGF